MSQRFENVELGLDEDLAEKLQWLSPNFSSFRILRKSIDARSRSRGPKNILAVEVFGENEVPPSDEIKLERISVPADHSRPIVVGSGPAGLFAALRLVERGIPCILLERGSRAEKRIVGINRYWRYGELDGNNNVCYGEGGAGLYSDGKLITRIKSPFIPYVMNRLVQFGAPEEIKYLANPHVGSDRIRRVIPKIRNFLLANGCEIHFDSPVTGFEFDQHSKNITGVQVTQNGDSKTYHSEHVVLATGHSAEDILHRLNENSVAMEGKSFALGLRIEHPQSLINQIQYRDAAEKLGAANYRLADHDDKTGIGVYSFCMCPGGYVLSSGTDLDGVVCNGMSNYNRNSPFANSAVVVSVSHKDRFKSDDLFAGLRFRKEIEREALNMVKATGGGKEVPTQSLIDFLENRETKEKLASSSLSGTANARLDQLLPKDITSRLQTSLVHFEKQMRGFISPKAVFHGVESRTSSPVRVLRDAVTLESISHRGLYPCGEGAGYAGGITSAACDGIRVAEAIASRLSAQVRLTTH
jgi:uncharacterized protein